MGYVTLTAAGRIFTSFLIGALRIGGFDVFYYQVIFV
jgi:hypothetical protein